MLLGLVGKPSSGKSTFFKAATMSDVLIASYPFGTIEPNHGMGYVRVDALCKELNVKCVYKNIFFHRMKKQKNLIPKSWVKIKRKKQITIFSSTWIIYKKKHYIMDWKFGTLYTTSLTPSLLRKLCLTCSIYIKSSINQS